MEDENKEEDSEDEDEVEDGGGKTDDGFGDNENARLLSKWEDEIKKLWDNLISDLTVLKRMTHSPNRKTPYNKFYEWEAWKRNDVNSKIAELNAKILTLRDGLQSPSESPTRKHGKKSNK